MELFAELLQKYIHLETESQIRLVETILLILGFLLLRSIFSWIIYRNTDDSNLRYQWQKTVGSLLIFVVAIWILSLWGVFRQLGTYLGLLSAGIAIALSDILANLAGWLFITWRRPFEIGDRVQIGPDAGDVVDTRIFQFTLMEIRNWVDADQSTGRLIHVPNRRVFTHPLANFTVAFPYIWHELSVMLTFESNWEKAQEILYEIVNRHAGYIVGEAERKKERANRKLMVKFGKLTPIVYTDVKSNGIQLTLRFLTGPRRRRSLNSAVWEDILRHFAPHNDITYAYPTQRIYADWIEGKRVGEQERGDLRSVE